MGSSLTYDFLRPFPNHQQSHPANQPAEETGLSDPRHGDRRLHHPPPALRFTLNSPVRWNLFNGGRLICTFCGVATQRRLSSVIGGTRILLSRTTFSWSSSWFGNRISANLNLWTCFHVGRGGGWCATCWVLFCQRDEEDQKYKWVFKALHLKVAWRETDKSLERL